jgi:hypothetical protein
MTQYSVCIIGNSHLAVFHQAWTKFASRTAKEFSLRFFVAPTQLLDYIRQRDGALIAVHPELKDSFEDTSGEKRIDLDRYDAFVIVGMKFGMNLAGVCGKRGTVEHAKWGPIDQLVSRAFFAEIVRAHFENAFALRLADMIRLHSQAPILLCPRPFVPENMLDDEGYRSEIRLRDPAFLEPVFRQCLDAATKAAASRDCEILWQNADTVTNLAFTKYEFSRSSTDPQNRRIEQDRCHANDSFGELSLLTLLNRLDELSGGRVLLRSAST